MVFFVCNGCNSSLRKKQVENHSYKCESGALYSCVDCSQEFDSYSYRKHTTCISEAEKYEGKLYKGNKSSGKVDIQSKFLHFFLDFDSSKFNADMKSVFSEICQFDNIPRKEKKFKNFVVNSLNIRRSSGRFSAVDRIWKEVKASWDKLLDEESKVKKTESQNKRRKVEVEEVKEKPETEKQDKLGKTLRKLHRKYDEISVNELVKKMKKKGLLESQTDLFETILNCSEITLNIGLGDSKWLKILP
eukprot:maker-scaffold_120-snap-gene-0.5-mRNA-1 protein AED:0.00 eAED:0.00 QI:64/1/1/1/1/1/2/141/245